MRSFLTIVVLVSVLSACSTAPSNRQPPAELPPLWSLFKIIEVWKASVGSIDEERYLTLQSAISGDRLFATDSDGDITALSLKDGRTLWEAELDQEVTAGVGADEKHIYVVTREGKLIALTAETGSTAWEQTVSSEVLSVPVVSGDNVVVQAVDGSLLAFDSKTGKAKWRFDKSEPSLSLRGTSTPLIFQNIVITGFGGGTIVALELATGRMIWELPVSLPGGKNEIERLSDVDARVMVIGYKMYAASYQGKLVAFDLRSGEKLWSKDMSVHTDMAADDLNLYVVDESGYVYAIDQTTGAVVWRQKQLLGRMPSPPVTADGYLIVGDIEGFLHWIRIDDGLIVSRLEFDDSPIRVRPAVKDNQIFVSSLGGRVALVKPDLLNIR